MSRKHRKPHQQQPSTTPHAAGREHQSENRHIYIESAVKVDAVDRLYERIKTNHDENTAHNNRQFVATVITAVLVFFYTGAGLWQVSIAHDTFNAANRPYIGISGVVTMYGERNEAGILVGSKQRTAKIESVTYTVEIKNFGPVPGSNYDARQRVWFGGVEMRVQQRDPRTNSRGTVFPGETTDIAGSLSGPEYLNFDPRQKGADRSNRP